MGCISDFIKLVAITSDKMLDNFALNSKMHDHSMSMLLLALSEEDESERSSEASDLEAKRESLLTSMELEYSQTKRVRSTYIFFTI